MLCNEKYITFRDKHNIMLMENYKCQPKNNNEEINVVVRMKIPFRSWRIFRYHYFCREGYKFYIRFLKKVILL